MHRTAYQLTVPSTYVLNSDCLTNTVQEAQENNSKWVFQHYTLLCTILWRS